MSKERHEPFGRPTSYCPELVEKILHRVATHSCGIRKICKMYDDMPNHETINEWRRKYSDFSALYLQARVYQSHLLAESTIDIADETLEYAVEDDKGMLKVDSGIVAAQDKRIKTRQWLAAQILPETYGPRAAAEAINDANTTEVAEKVAKIIKESEKEY